MPDDFCVFILTHQRPDRVFTYRTLRRCGYQGPIHLVVDTDDPTLPEYKERYGDQLLLFDKDEVADRIHKGDNFPGRQTSLYAREKIWDFAEEMGVEYFFMLDDDYDWMGHRIGPEGEHSTGSHLEYFNEIMDAMIDYMDDTPITTLAFSQGGDWIGGKNTTFGGVQMRRKAMNSFLCKTDRKFRFRGRINGDATCYTLLGLRGRLFFTYMPIMLTQKPTQSNPGGVTETYVELGTYVKTFYTIMHAPACVSVSTLGHSHPRFHHHISGRKTYPKILHEKHKKGT